MDVISLNCNHCGAPLEVPKETRFLTCQYCKTRLEVQQTGSAAFTRTLEQLEERADHIAHDVEVLKHEQELQRIDREWEMERQSYMIRSKDGSVSEPSTVGAGIGMVVVIVFGIFWTVMAASMGAPVIFPIFGVIFILVGVGACLSGISKAKEYQARQRAYYLRRQGHLDRRPDRHWS